MDNPQPQFKGFFVPNSTQVPDALFDELMADLSGAELKTVLYIIRRTFGFKKQSDTISISQLLGGITKNNGEELDHGTGLSKPSLLSALKSLAERNIIIPTRKYDAKGGNMPTEYRLNILSTQQPPRERGDEIPPSKEILPRGLGKENIQGGVKKIDQALVKKLASQGTVLQGTENTVNVNGFSEKTTEQPAIQDKTDLRKLPDLNVPKEQTQFMVKTILNALGDEHSQNFYYLVSSKIPERYIHKTLSEIKQDGARFPERVFAHRMKTYAEEIMNSKTQEKLFDMRKSLADSKKLA
jgi:hypothetical protein